MTPFAFYGRVSTEDQQDPKTSREWQLARSQSLIAPHAGEVVAEYFDIGTSRSLCGSAAHRRLHYWRRSAILTVGSTRW